MSLLPLIQPCSAVKFLLLYMWAGEQIKEKYQNSCNLKTESQNNEKSNQHILGINMNIHTKYEVSISIYVGRRANQRKVP